MKANKINVCVNAAAITCGSYHGSRAESYRLMYDPK